MVQQCVLPKHDSTDLGIRSIIVRAIYTLVGGLEHDFYFSIQLGMSSSQLTNSMIFQRGRSTTNQIIMNHHYYDQY
jgi:hypothetical protein